MSRALGKRLRQIQGLVEAVVGDLGFAPRPTPLAFSGQRTSVWTHPVSFRERDFLCRTHREVGELVLDRTRAALEEAIGEIRVRGGDPTWGFRVSPCTALRGLEGWTAGDGDYACFLAWSAPQVFTPLWPHPVANDGPEVKETDLGTEADEAALLQMDVSDYRKLVSGDRAQIESIPDARTDIPSAEDLLDGAT